jgi:hypothetical protein
MKQTYVVLDYLLKAQREEDAVPLCDHQDPIKRAEEGDEELKPRNDVAVAESAWADHEEASDLGSRQTDPVVKSNEAGGDVLHGRAEEQRVYRDDGGNVGTAEAGAKE